MVLARAGSGAGREVARNDWRIGMIGKLAAVALAGGLGTLARYGLAGAAQRLLGAGFPWGTLAVNLAGSFLFGVVWTVAAERAALGAELRLIVLTGFMGAFTTFSTFMFETGELLRAGQWLLALGNLAAQNIAGIAAVFLGWAAGRALLALGGWQ